MYREILFKRIPDGFRVKERVNGMLESVYSCSFESAFRRMSELKDEGFDEEKLTYESDFVFRYHCESRT